MVIYNVFLVNRAGGLIYDYDHNVPKTEIEKTFSYPLEPVLKLFDSRVVVSFGQRDGVKVGHSVLAINGIQAVGTGLDDGREILEVIADENNYPISIKFGRPRLYTNEKIMLASMFHSLFAIGCQLSPEVKSSGIEVMETDTCKLWCTQTMTGIKFIVLADARQGGIEQLLKKLYEIYSDFALKNPFYSIDMPIRCDLFDSNLLSALEQVERFSLGNT